MKRIVTLSLVLLVMVIGQFAFAQGKGERTNTRSVQGTVRDPGDAVVEKAVVQLKDTKTLQIRSFITRQDGTYHFHGLNPDIDYELRAEYQGAASGTKTLSAFDSRKQAVINLKLDEKK